MDPTLDMKCQVCSQEAFKYKCPQCVIRTCSLPCVKKHKAESGCSGIRNKTEYVSVKNFTEMNLLSDYRFLEDAGRKADVANRSTEQRGRSLKKPLKKLLVQARNRNINFQLMPSMFTKRRVNKTCYNPRLKTIFWDIEWVFPQAEAKYSVRKNDENETVGNCLGRLIGEEGDPIVRHALRKYLLHPQCEYLFFIKVEEQRSNCVRYHKIDPSKTIAVNLAHKIVIEYPTILVVLPKFSNLYPLIEDENKKSERVLPATSGVCGKDQCEVTLSGPNIIMTTSQTHNVPNQKEPESSDIVERERQNDEVISEHKDEPQPMADDVGVDKSSLSQNDAVMKDSLTDDISKTEIKMETSEANVDEIQSTTSSVVTVDSHRPYAVCKTKLNMDEATSVTDEIVSNENSVCTMEANIEQNQSNVKQIPPAGSNIASNSQNGITVCEKGDDMETSPSWVQEIPLANHNQTDESKNDVRPMSDKVKIEIEMVAKGKFENKDENSSVETTDQSLPVPKEMPAEEKTSVSPVQDASLEKTQKGDSISTSHTDMDLGSDDPGRVESTVSDTQDDQKLN